MKWEKLADNIILITDCPHPDRDREACAEIARAGVHSLLIVGDNPTPCPVGIAGLWCYILPFVDPLAPTAFEEQCISDFSAYERAHGRTLGLWTKEDRVRTRVCQAACASAEHDPHKRILPAGNDTTCCKGFHPGGCDGQLLCHASPLAAAQQILDCGYLYSKHRLTNLPLEQLAAQGTWGDPADYFDFVALARGNCVAPDIVAMSRSEQKNLSPKQAEERFYPGVRFYFNTAKLLQHPRASFDGIHPIKIRDRLELEPYVRAIVAPRHLPNGEDVHLTLPGYLSGRMVQLDHQRFCSLTTWSDAAFHAAQSVPAQ